MVASEHCLFRQPHKPIIRTNGSSRTKLDYCIQRPKPALNTLIGNARSESLTKGSLSDDSDSTLGSFRVRLDLGLRVSHHSQPRREATRPRSSKKERTIIFPLSGVPRGREKASGGHLSAAVPARRREKLKYDPYSNSNKAVSRPRHVGKCSIIKGVFVRDSQ